ncbi:50S ribosomal protein L34e [Candidatus Woesearchaeota archaeon]|nr:50S ribosomal protein L34e [Candidatus Woesearchaeota archaeon]
MTRKRKSAKTIKVQRAGRYGRLKSRKSLRQVFVKTPGGKTVVHYKKKKPGKAHCAECGALLQGIPRELPVKMKNMPKTEKRPQRPYGGFLCSKCARKKIIAEFRK